MRADARRNRDAILAAARELFESEGILAPIDGIATRAGVGNATLYRNFPTRDDLLAAVMTDTVHRVIDDSAELEDREPVPALQEWMFRLAWGLRVWQDLPTCIADAVDDEDSPVRTICSRLTARTAEFLERARGTASGTDDEVDASTVFELLTAVSWGLDRFGDDEARARKRVRLATAGVVAAA
ncbi:MULTISPECIES: TetR/AcrR family transcriptional regulator [unclassified Curtobacterium]|uniref:TetR/AcrR family transcriptional regulator n=1 Tax=unclassified Curtobacterium TaxID=257496 RepID=UPI000A743794|nr:MULTISPECIES: TetR/AcrR family transcriptional regulator [unclassified Curtobacterium]